MELNEFSLFSLSCFLSCVSFFFFLSRLLLGSFMTCDLSSLQNDK